MTSPTHTQKLTNVRTTHTTTVPEIGQRVQSHRNISETGRGSISADQVAHIEPAARTERRVLSGARVR